MFPGLPVPYIIPMQTKGKKWGRPGNEATSHHKIINVASIVFAYIQATLHLTQIPGPNSMKLGSGNEAPLIAAEYEWHDSGNYDIVCKLT